MKEKKRETLPTLNSRHTNSGLRSIFMWPQISSYVTWNNHVLNKVFIHHFCQVLEENLSTSKKIGLSIVYLYKALCNLQKLKNSSLDVFKEIHLVWHKNVLHERWEFKKHIGGSNEIINKGKGWCIMFQSADSEIFGGTHFHYIIVFKTVMRKLIYSVSKRKNWNMALLRFLAI